MKDQNEYIRRLYLEKLSGLLSEEEELQLQQFLAGDNQASEYWKFLEEEGRDLQIENFIEQLDTEDELVDLKSKMVTNNPNVFQLKSWLVGTVAAMIMVGLFLVFNNSNNSSESVLISSFNLQSNDTLPSKIILELYDGQQISLSKNDSLQFSTGALILTNDKGVLSINSRIGTVESLKMNRLYVPVGQDYTLILPDGSKVFLNSNTEFQFPSSFNNRDFREVYLKGEGYFEVVSNSKQPLRITTQEANVEVKGTILNVCAYENDRFITSLVEGKVSITNSQTETINLLPGKEVVSTSNGRFTTKSFDIENIILKKKGTYVFDQECLEDLSSIIYNWYGIRVQFDSPEIARLKVSGLLEKKHLDDFLTDLKTTTGLECTLQSTNLLLSKN